MQEWYETTLGELCSLKAGSAFKTHFQGRKSGKFPFVKVSDMNLPENEICIRAANHWIEEDVRAEIKAKPLPPGTTVFAKIGEALKQNRVRYLVRDTIVDNNMMGAVPNQKKLDPRFFFYCLSNFDIAGTATGTALPYLTVSTLSKCRFSIPPLPVQERIAGILSAYDELIENSQRRIKILETMARALYREWFVHFRFPGHENHPRIASPLGEIPQGWEVGRLDDVLVLQRGFDLPKAARAEGSVPIIAATGVTGFHNEAKVKAPGVVTGRSGTIGEVLYVQDDFWPLNTSLWVKEFPKAEPLFAYYLLSQLDLKQFNSGAAVPTLNRNDIHGISTVVPPRDLQKRFQEIAGAMLAQTRTLKLKIQNLRRTRDLLLPRLLSGQIALSEDT
jgi:type I restriction enzyme, S subunit